MTIDPHEFIATLTEKEINLWAGVPDSLLKELCAAASESLGEQFLITANEGNAVGIACGWHLATGKAACVYMQNSGQGNAINPLLSIADPDVYSIPMLLIVGWRGEPGVHDEPQHVKQGKVTCELFSTMDIPYDILDLDVWQSQLDDLLATMQSESRPVALVVRKGTFAPEVFEPAITDDPLSREEALESLLSCLTPNDFIVSTTGKTSREVFEIRERSHQVHSNDFLTVGGMGHTSSIAYGLALGRDKDVWCIDGDGSFLMHMGAFPVMAQRLPKNFHYVLNINGAHESVGGQPNVAGDVDVPAILYASGFKTVVEASTADEINTGVSEVREKPSAALVIHTHQGSRADLGRPTTTPQENKAALMEAVARRAS